MSKVRTDILEQAQAIAHAQRVSARYLPDDAASSLPGAYFAEWTPGVAYERDDKVIRLGQLYNVEQAHTAQESYLPEGEGMLALYRPIVPEHAGTVEDPMPWVYGMDCKAGLHYVHEGVVYKARQNMLPCVWEPGGEGAETMWEVTE